MKTKDLLNEWKNFLNKEMINEVSLKIFQQQHPDFDTSSFSSQLRGNTDYLDIISNTINAGQNHSSEDFVQQFEFYKNSIEPNRNSQDFLTVNIPGESDPVSLVDKVTQGSCTATYDDIQQFQQVRMFVLGKGSRNKLAATYSKILEEANDSDFELVAENSDWIIYYPKTIRGSIALARSYWNGNKIAYDNTFNPSKGYGQNAGNMNWCTSISGSGNMFLNYHRKLNRHMYYCIKKSIRSVKDPARKLCISFSKNAKQDPSIQFRKGTASVNADNKSISEEYSKNNLGSLFDNLLKDVADAKRLEIDVESYYKSISIDQYIIMRNANEENISDFQNEVVSILKHSKDSNKIIYHVAKDSNSEIRNIAAEKINAPPEIILDLASDKEINVRYSIARRADLLEIDPSGEIIRKLAKDKSKHVRAFIAGRKDLLEIDPSGEIIRKFLKDRSNLVRLIIADRADLLEIDPSGEIIRNLVNDKSKDVRAEISKSEELAKLDDAVDLLRKLSNDEAPHIRSYVSESLKSNKNESILRDYIKLLMS